MSLTLTMIKSPEDVTPVDTCKVFYEGGSIGRGPDNTWVLSDPECYLSTRHCEIRFEDGVYVLTDKSMNGTFYNGAPEAIGAGHSVILKYRDRFVIGDYEFSVTAIEDELIGRDGPFSDKPDIEPNIYINTDERPETDVEYEIIPDIEPVNPTDKDIMDIIGETPVENPGDVIEKEIIPERWDETELTIPPKTKDTTTGVKAEIETSGTTLLETLGLAKYDLTPAQAEEIHSLIGQAMRETILGLMQGLSARNAMKNEFRINVTTIKPVENNPLKFSANIDDALENMFIKKGGTYKNPVDSIKDAFLGMAEHQLAMMAGIQHAFKTLIERFEPERLVKRFEKTNKGGILPGTQKAKHWDSYTDYYHILVDDLDNSFKTLFGDAFVRAYEEQMQKFELKKK